MSKLNYNPDVLSCLANLSSDEVFTPPQLANQMLDMLPQELFQSPDTKFLDPCTKSGVFLREIAKRLIDGLADKIPNLQERIDHIMQHQLYGIAITRLTALMSRRSLYCSKDASCKYSLSHFDDADGNIHFDEILHTWQNGKCIYCGASQDVYDRGEDLETHAYEFIHTDNPNELYNNMTFDVIIGNPPYQLSDGGSGKGISALPLYNKFVEQSERLNPRYLIMIIPSRWFAGGRGLNDFRETMLNDCRIKYLVDYPKSRDCFPGVDIAGGVCYFLWDREYDGLCNFKSIVKEAESNRIRKLNEFDIFIRDNIGLDIVHKVISKSEKFYSSLVYSSTPFGLRSFYRGKNREFPNAVILHSSDGISYIEKDEITRNIEILNTYKVYIGKINPDRGGVNNASDGMMNVTTKVNIIGPNEIITETYLLLNKFDNRNNANNCASYFKTRFVRYLISVALTSMNIAKENFKFVPLQDFSKPWTDEELFKKYNLTEEEIAFIESMIRPME
jgi:site-specific DNA-methyltransferase (adenine-specific)